MDPDHHNNDDNNNDAQFKSKNLIAERKRRKKLSDRQLELRALVPVITNMNKATIITDAIAYIEELKRTVDELQDQLDRMEAMTRTTGFSEEKIKVKERDTHRGMNKLEEAEIEINHFCGNKLWMKMVFEKKRGALTKLLEAINVMGILLNDTSITTSRGAVLFTSFGEGIHGGLPEAEQMKKYLLEVVRAMDHNY